MARIKVEIPEALQSETGGAATLDAAGDTVGAALADLGSRNQILVRRVLTRGGTLRRHVKLFLNNTNVHLDVAIAEGDTLIVVPSVAGG